MNRKEYKKFYNIHHGLHVLDEVFIKDCPHCAQRKQIIMLAKLEGINPKKALESSIISNRLLGKQDEN